jgi:hypothetical protein
MYPKLISIAIVESFLEKIGQSSTEKSWVAFLEEFRVQLAVRVLKMESDWQVNKQLKLAEKLSTVLDEIRRRIAYTRSIG